MKQRGRKSTANLAVIQGSFGTRAEPPGELTPRQAQIWRETVNSEAVDFFATAALKGILADYCRHRESVEQVSQIIGSFDPAWMKSGEGASRYASLCRMRELETRAASAMATKLRLTNQARYTPQAASTASQNAAKGCKPWEV